jgi:hypothetical protein
MSKQVSAESFLKDVATHAMVIHLDNGPYRHLSFRRPAPNSWNQWFELVTWPGKLTISGDMGTWVFARVSDMFTFFRSRPGCLYINASYWEEKIEAESRFGGPALQFSPERFKDAVLNSLEGYGLDEPDKAGVIAALEEEVFSEEVEDLAYQALREFRHIEFTFNDASEISGRDYSFHYLWCLHAIVWGIQQYDATKGENQMSKQVSAEAATRTSVEGRMIADREPNWPIDDPVGFFMNVPFVPLLLLAAFVGWIAAVAARGWQWGFKSGFEYWKPEGK